MVGILATASPAAWAGDDAPAKAPPAAQPSPSAYELLNEMAGAAMVGWIRDPEASADGTPIRTWLLQLGSRDAVESAAARRALLHLGREALPWIAIGLGDRAGLELRDACADLARELVGAAGVDLAAAATDPRLWMRRVAWAAARGGGPSEDARRDALGDDDAVVRREAAYGFVRTPPTKPATLDALEAALGSEDFGERAAAALTLLRVGGPAAARFTASLERPETRKGFAATWLLGSMPIEAGDAVAGLLTSPSWHVRSHAATSLALAPSISEAALRALAKALDDPSGDVRWRATCALDRPEARGAEAALRARLADAVPDVRTAAAVALTTLGATGKDVVEALGIALLASSPHAGTGVVSSYEGWAGPRWYLLPGFPMPAARIAQALGRHGAPGVAVVRQATKGRDVEARRLAVSAYDAAAGAGTEALLEALGDGDGGVRRASAMALARRGDARTEVVEALARGVEQDWIENGRIERLDLLLSLDTEALPAIRTLLAKGDPQVRPGLCAALVTLGERGASALPEVLLLPDAIEILPGEHSSDTSFFEKVIRSIGAAGVPGLIEAIRSDDPARRGRAFAACRLLGPLAKDALPAIREALAAKRIPGFEDTSADEALRWFK